ncbi:MAG TPA: DUF5977 domain-containing protein [Chitinophagaceae bacterium]
MKPNRKSIFFIGILFVVLRSYSQSSPDNQAALEKIIPIAPTAASIAKYGNIPISYFTGSPSVSIPLFEAKSGNLVAPVTLNYQFNGLKVEEIASWVGLGWSLQAGGAISRTVRGIADEDAYGYMNPGIPMTVKFMIDSMAHPGYEDTIKYYLRQAGKRLYDLEPDIFFFNFPGGSGKFYYDQERMNFFSMPAQNIKISYANEKFLIVAGDGTRYHFSIKEITTANAPQCTGSQAQAGNSSNTSSWYISKIENNTQTDSITFEYADISYNFDNLSTSTKYRLILSQGCAAPGKTPPSFPDQLCWQNTAITGKRLSYIRFRNGYLKFTAHDSERSDLPGDKALKKIELFNSADVLIKRQSFEYGYFGSGSANAMRLKLTNVNETSSDSSIISPHAFIYEENGAFPSRLSYAQDHWGYFNGVTTNTSLIPSMLWKDISGNSHYEQGDDRLPVFEYVKLGALKTITYPTRGTTEFEYENNEVKDTLIQPNYTWHTEHIEGDHNGGVQTLYIDTFVVNEPSNFYNFNDPDGGAYVDFAYADIGCSFPGGASTCAILTVEGISSGTVSYGPFITTPMKGTYLPNGTYILKASFNQNPPLYEDFYFSASWRQPVLSNSYPVGGLRIKKIVDYDSLDISKKIIRNVTYASDTDLLSSGKVYGYTNSYTTDFHHEFYSSEYVADVCVECSLFRDYIKFNSNSNYPLIAHQGGYVGYEQVNVFYGNNGENGKSVYKYKNFPDIIGGFPTISTSKEWERGILLRENTFNKVASAYTLINKDSLIYSGLNDYDTSLLKISYGLKSGFKTTVTIAEDGCGGEVLWLQRENEALVPTIEEYETITGRNVVASKQSTLYEGVNQLQTIEEYDYNTKNYLPKKSISLSSTGDTLISRIKYNVDYSLVSNNPSWLYKLSDKNASVIPVERLTIRKAAGGSEYVIAGAITQYKGNKPLPDKIYVLETNTPIPLSSFTQSSVDGSGNFIKDSRYKEAISFNTYDSYNNLLEQQKTNDVKNDFIWDYTSTLPIAEVINADTTSIAYTSFEADSKGGWTYSDTVSTDATSPTGSKCYFASGGNITKSVLTSATYIVSYWGKNGSVNVNSAGPTRTGKTIGNWTYYEHEITTTDITVSGSNYFDELRLYPKGALMTTYTYNPLIGMTSQCDANNRITYYEYDKFGRLAIVKDQDNKILKIICYNYAGQTENCSSGYYANVQKSGSFSKNNCSSGYQGTSVTYIVPSGSYNLPVSQSYVDSLAQADVNTNGQAYANANGSCLLLYYSVQKSGNFTRNNCGTGYTGSTVTYTVPANTYNSTTSQAAADQLAQTDVNNNGQAYANANGTCTATCNSSNCNAVDKKCINGVCETGWRVCTDSQYQSGTGMYLNTYHYEWSDQSWSQNYFEYSYDACF